MGAFGDKLAEVVHRDPCFRKERHDSPGAADAQIRSLLQRGLAKNPKRIHKYICVDCTKRYGHTVWHVGHRGSRRDDGA